MLVVRDERREICETNLFAEKPSQAQKLACAYHKRIGKDEIGISACSSFPDVRLSVWSVGHLVSYRSFLLSTGLEIVEIRITSIVHDRL
jgi:hypothetical protein